MSKQTSNNPFGFWKVILLLIMAGAVVLSISPVSAEKPFVTIVAKGDQSYYMGEKVVFSGMNTDSDSTYLFITGPNLAEGGGKLASPNQNATSGNPGSFTLVKTKPDKTWEYTWYTSDVSLGAGTYTIYAVTKPETKDQFNDLTTYGTVGIIYKKPFITGEISPSSVSPGQPFTISGVAEGIPPEVQVWILGNNYLSRSIESVNSTDASYKYVVPGEVTSKFAAGQYFAIVQHPMRYNKFNIDVSGDYVKLNNDTTIFKITGPGSLQGSDAADALTAAISDQEANDKTLANDTYTLIPFQVTNTGSGATAGTGVTISTDGDKSYYLGEKVVIRGRNTDSDTTYLFITGPGTFKDGPGIPAIGGKLTSPLQEVVSGNPDSFTTVKTKTDKTWEYVYYTANLPVDAGTYNIYAVSQPKALDLAGPAAAGEGIILKKPFITAQISPSSVLPGQPFTVSGFAEGDPETVQIWILGKNYYSRSVQAVNPDASYTYTVPREVTSQLASGQYLVVVQHAMQNTTFDIDVNGDYVRSLQLNNGTNLFRISGPGSLQGNDAADALVAAFSDPVNGDDTYTEIPFQVTDAGNPTPQATDASTAPVQQSTKYGLLGAIGEAFRSFF
ncbi:hypothetical protein [Methanoregula sp.]|uniref:hypothetical protein n=1 Tax=Methanoregula sp. TaxID=2052170 RepID=UPI0023731288|nr:hypothetical protein [Methanoregula sp.]MDD1687543.1 hypothetical protein [Methanoregula sp.]